MLYWELVQFMDTYLMSRVADTTELDCMGNYRRIAPTACKNIPARKHKPTSLWSTVRIYLEVAIHLLVKTVKFKCLQIPLSMLLQH